MQSGEVVDNRFELERLAGAGAMGEVWRAKDRTTGTPVAVKLLCKTDEGWDTRFVREALSLAQLDHPGIVKYVAHGQLPAEGFYLAMEWLDGEDLSQTLARGPLTIDETIGLVRRVAEALAFAHEHGIVHRDIKPGNLFLPDGSLGRVKVVDFGVAKIKDFTGTWTRNGWMLGTPAYMAPEQVRGERNIDSRVDLFALGCVAFECATGRLAFGGGQVLASLRSILHDEAPRLASVVSGVPPEFDELIARMMTKDPAGRPSHASEVARALSGFDIPSERPGTDARRRRALTTGEQRIVTVLMVAGDKLTKRSDARTTIVSSEASPDELDPTHELAALTGKTGAKFERFAGDSFVLSLPAGGVPTDRAAQAARCALALARIVPGKLIALATGPREPGEWTESAAIDRATHLLLDNVGRSGAILLDDTTARLLEARFEIVHGEGCLELRGENETGSTPKAGEMPTHAATLLGRPITCVGRDREIAAIKASLAQCVDESVARAVLVTAPAGAGKSRVLRELLTQIRAASPDDALGSVRVLLARADPLNAGSAYGLTSQLMRQAAASSRPPGSSDAPPASESMQRAFDAWLTGECKKGPLLLVLEDLQWGDLPSVKLLDTALRDLRDSPLMVLAFARPEVHDLFPKLWAEREPEEVRLGTLTKSASERLVQQAVGDSVTPEEVAKIVEQADGNPFYIEELCRAASAHREKVPETLLAMVQARLEKLDPTVRRVLRAASVYGRTFWRGGVMALVGGNLNIDDLLAALVAARLVAKRDTCRFRNEEEYFFADPLVREGAYALLTDADRALGHELAGEWLERMGEPDEAVITGHREKGGSRQSA
jgi:serine/threonine protein kinase